MSNDKVDATFHPGRSYRIYPVTHHERDGESWFECPICGRLADDKVREHGPEHIVEDASQ